MIVAFLRHGATAWNEEGRMQGRRDVPLSERGRAEVEAWRAYWTTLRATRFGANSRSGAALRAHARFADVVPATTPWYSSPLRRAVETAEIMTGAAPRSDPALIEMDWGDWEGLRLPELRDRYGESFARNEAAGLDFRPLRGESPRDVRTRVVRWLTATAAVHDSIVVVTHKGVLRAVLSAATGWDMTAKPPLRLNCAALHRFEIETGGKIGVLEPNIPLALP
jgi:probable phosphoglycerate mutase